MKKTDLGKFLLASAFLAAPAAAQDLTFDSLPSVKDIVSQARTADLAAPLPALTRDTKAVKEWTIMVFMNGKNNLSSYVHTDMNEMEAVGSTDKVNVVVEAGRTYQAPPSNPGYPGDYDDWYGGGVVPHPGWPNPYWGGLPPRLNKDGSAVKADESWTGVRRYYVTKDADTAVTGSTLVQDLGKADMGDWNHLVDFAKWAKTNYPAKKYMLIVWNHGDGWKTKSLGAEPSIAKGISYDDETGNNITTVQLGQALGGLGGVDIYASDACLMQMAEVVYELKNYAPVIVGSEETEPGDGWDYAAFLSRLNNLTPEGVAKAAVEGYNASYAAKGKGVTMSAVRSVEAEPLRALMDQWAVLAMTQDKAKLKEALTESLGFGGADSRDLPHFLSLAGAKLPALQGKGAEIRALVANRMLIRNAPVGDSFKNSFGLGVYLPSYSFDENYNKLALSKAGKWDEFTKWLTAN